MLTFRKGTQLYKSYILFHFIPNSNKEMIKIIMQIMRMNIQPWSVKHALWIQSKHTTWPNSRKRLTTSEKRNNPGLHSESFWHWDISNATGICVNVEKGHKLRNQNSRICQDLRRKNFVVVCELFPSS